MALILLAKMSYAECVEYKIIDHGDSVEAVCVGQSTNEAQKKESEITYSLQEEKDIRNAIIDCNASLPSQFIPASKGKITYQEINQNYEYEKARCKKLDVDLGILLKSKQESNVVNSNVRSNDSASQAISAMQGQMAAQSANQQAEMQRQQAEIQRQQFEMQRIQQQQKFNQIWNK
jgi:hypothetical protein